MPKITQYDSPDNLGLRPTEVGITATAAAARRVGAEYSEAAAAQRATAQNIAETVQSIGSMALRFAEHQEIASGMAESARITDGLTKSKDARIASLDPNDPAYGQKVEAVTAQWREQTLQPALENFGKGFVTTKGQQWAQQFVGSTRESMFRQTTADVANAAGIGIKNNIKNFVGISSNNALRNPEMVDDLLANADRSVSALVASSPVKGTQAANFQSQILQDTKRQIVEAGAFGAIQKSADPEAVAQEWIKKYPEYIDGKHAITLGRAAATQQKANQLSQKQTQLVEKQLGEQAASNAARQLIADHVKVDPANPSRVLVDPKYFQGVLDIAQMPHASSSDVRALINWGEQQQKEKKEVFQSDPVIRQDLLTRMDVNDNRTTEIEILKAEANGKLERSDAAQLLRLQKATSERPEGEPIKRSRQGMTYTYRNAIDPSMGMDVLSANKFDLFQWDMREREKQLIEQGKSPMLVYDPNSEHWFGHPANLLKYKVSDQERTRFNAAVRAANTPASSRPIQAAPKINPNAERGSMENPIVIPRGTTVEQASELKLEKGQYIIDPSGRLRRWGK